MNNTKLEQLLNQQERQLMLLTQNHQLIRLMLEREVERERFLDKNDVAEITGLDPQTSAKVILKINKKIKEVKPEAVHQGRVLESNFYEFYKVRGEQDVK